MTERIFLVSCVGRKRAQEAPAADLYTSTWFIKARAFVERTGGPWFILSAEHGLLRPEQIIGPYDRTLNRMSADQRQSWAALVKTQMESELPDAEEVVILAGVRYRENVVSYLQSRFSRVMVPMEGLAIGKQLSWLSHENAF